MSYKWATWNKLPLQITLTLYTEHYKITRLIFNQVISAPCRKFMQFVMNESRNHILGHKKLRVTEDCEERCSWNFCWEIILETFSNNFILNTYLAHYTIAPLKNELVHVDLLEGTHSSRYGGGMGNGGYLSRSQRSDSRSAHSIPTHSIQRNLPPPPPLPPQLPTQGSSNSSSSSILSDYRRIDPTLNGRLEISKHSLLEPCNIKVLKYS